LGNWLLFQTITSGPHFFSQFSSQTEQTQEFQFAAFTDMPWPSFKIKLPSVLRQSSCISIILNIRYSRINFNSYQPVILFYEGGDTVSYQFEEREVAALL
jgi:hypothetical protein